MIEETKIVEEINWRIKVTDPSLVTKLHKALFVGDEVCGIKFEKVFKGEKGNEKIFLIAKKVGQTCKSRIMLYPYKKCMFQFNIPNVLRDYIGKGIKIFEHNGVDVVPGELFRIEPDGFEFSIQTKPYFTLSHFCMPIGYINDNLKQNAMFLRACFNRNTLSMLKGGLMQVFLTKEKTLISSPLYWNRNSLRARNLKAMIENVHKCGLTNIKHFAYTNKKEETGYEYGIMEFSYQEPKDE
jgi:hypothetical protein